MIAHAIEIGDHFGIVAIFFFELGKWRPHEIIRRLGFGCFQFFSDLSFEFFTFAQSVIDLLLDLASAFLQTFFFRRHQRHIFRFLHGLAVLRRQ